MSHLVAEEPPRDPRDRQAVAALLDDLMTRLRACGSSSSSSSSSGGDANSAASSSPSSFPASTWPQAVDNGDLAALVCALSKLRAFNGPLLREAAAEARQRAREGGGGGGAGGMVRPRQAAGLIWAFAR